MCGSRNLQCNAREPYASCLPCVCAIAAYGSDCLHMRTCSVPGAPDTAEKVAAEKCIKRRKFLQGGCAAAAADQGI